MVLDIGMCQDSAWGYVIDHLDIPLYRKIVYSTPDVTACDYTNILGVPSDLRNNSVFFDSEAYTSLEQADKFSDKTQNYIFSDYCFDPDKYYKNYWPELRTMLHFREKNANVERFKEIIKERVSVGVHIRRGDMLFADFAIDMADDYYRAAIEYCRKNIDRNALFCVFSDDIEYAEKLFGNDENIRYIHILGYDNADLEEFICLSLCDHRILSNSSTYSILADRLNGSTERKTIFQGDLGFSVKKCVKRFLRKPKLALKKTARMIIHGSASKEWEGIYLDAYDIRKYSNQYKRKGNTPNKAKITKNKVIKPNISNASKILEEIRDYEFDFRSLGLENDLQLRLMKFRALNILGRYEECICQADYIWGLLRNDNAFKGEYAELLRRLGLYEESGLVSYHAAKQIHYIVISGIPSLYSSRLVGMGEIAVGLKKMGQMVTLFEKPKDDTEKAYIEKNKYLTTRHGVCLGCRQYLYESVPESKYERIIEQEKDLENLKTVVISRDQDVFDEKIQGILYIFPDFLDVTDPERKYKDNIDPEKIELMKEKADYILTADRKTYAAADEDRLIVFENNTGQYPYWEVNRLWEWHDCHRLSKRAINVCVALEEKLQNRMKDNNA